ncbi:MAG TPA: hypothetical protein VN931_05880 [Fibrobacteria bacterium]|nr:hypothetical protein [Fibrobacteria bacterium]
MRGLLLAVVLLPFALCRAQFSGSFPLGSSPGSFPALGPGSEQPVLADSRTFQMHQSVTVSAMSGGGGSLTQSMVQNQIDYRLSDPLTLQLGLGILTPLQATGVAAQGFQRGAYLIPDVGLEYRPSESLLFALRYVGIPSSPLGTAGGSPWH